MDTRDPCHSPQGQVSQDDGDMCLKMDSNPVIDHTQSPFVTCGERPQDGTNVTPHAPAVITMYYSVMDDEGIDDVFIPSPPRPCMAPELPVEGSTNVMAYKSSVTLTKVAADATEAKANPSGLDWHHDEKQLMAAHNQMDEVKASTAHTSEEPMDTVSPFKGKDSTLPKDKDLASMEESLVETCHDLSEGNHQDNITGDEESNERPGDIVILSRVQENWRKTEAERDKYPEEVPSNFEENSENDEEDMCSIVETDPTVSSLSVNDDAFKSCGPEILRKVSNNEGEHVNTRSLNNTITKYDEMPQLPITEDTEDTPSKEEQMEDGSRRIATDIQQGEQLLQRLQLLQLRQDVLLIPQGPRTSQEGVEVTIGEKNSVLGTEADLTGRDKSKEKLFHTVEAAEGEHIHLMEKERNPSEHLKAQPRMSSPETPAEPDSWVPVDLSQIYPHETSSAPIPFVSTSHRFSVTETNIERQILEAALRKQNLQRASGVFNLAEDPDVLEIPFKTDILLEHLQPDSAGTDRCTDQFSEQKMQKEISQEMQRELVKIPGEYSKGGVHQLKEKKLLFEAFQQDNTDGPTTSRKPPIALTKGHVYPSVLERTCSLKMLSHKSGPVSQAHSIKQNNPATSDVHKSPKALRSKSPQTTRSFPCLKQDKNVYPHKSMDHISSDDVSTSAVESTSKTRQKDVVRESPIVKQNPFFKLRPALALQPEVEKDILEARDREEELQRQRCSLYGNNKQDSRDGEKMLTPDVKQQSRGKLERVWPPPSKKDQMKSEQTQAMSQQEPKVQKAGGQKAALWQRWESGLINGKPSKNN